MVDKLEELKKVYFLDNKIFNKKLYNLYEENYFNKTILELVSKYVDEPISLLNNRIKDYVKTETKMSYESFLFYKKNIKSKYSILFLNIENVVLKEIGITTYVLWNNEKEKEYVIKNLYKLLVLNNFSTQICNSIKDILKINKVSFEFLFNEILSFDEKYNKKYLKAFRENPKETWASNSIWARENNINKINIYKDILNIDDYRKVGKTFKDFKFTINIIKNDFRFFEMFFTDKEAVIIKEKIDQYSNYIKKSNIINANEKRVESTNDLIKNIYNDYLNSHELIDNIYIKYNISSSLRIKYFNRLKTIDKDLYDKVILKMKKEEENKKQEIENVIEELTKIYERKIIDNGIERKFDLLDYFSITNLPIRDVYFELRKVSENMSLRNFLHNNCNYDNNIESDKKLVLEEKKIIGIEFDSFNNPVKGTGREVTMEEKNNIINYIVNNNIPFNVTTYNIAFKRYINGTLKMSDKKLKLTLD